MDKAFASSHSLRGLRPWRSMLVLLATPLLAASCTWVVRDRPDPFAGKTAYTVQPVDYNGLMMGDKTEQQYLAGKSQETQSSWEGDKQGIAQNFGASFEQRAVGIGLHQAAAPGPEVVVVRPAIYWVEVGTFNGFFNRPSEARARIVYTDAAGAVLDQIDVQCAVRADLLHPSSGQRLRDCAHQLGDSTAAHIARYRHY